MFDDEVRQFVAPSGRQGHLHRVLHAIERAVPGKRTDYAKPFFHFQQFLTRRGIVAVMSDFWDDPELIAKTISLFREFNLIILIK